MCLSATLAVELRVAIDALAIGIPKFSLQRTSAYLRNSTKRTFLRALRRELSAIDVADLPRCLRILSGRFGEGNIVRSTAGLAATGRLLGRACLSSLRFSTGATGCHSKHLPPTPVFPSRVARAMATRSGKITCRTPRRLDPVIQRFGRVEIVTSQQSLRCNFFSPRRDDRDAVAVAGSPGFWDLCPGMGAKFVDDVQASSDQLAAHSRPAARTNRAPDLDTAYFLLSESKPSNDNSCI